MKGFWLMDDNKTEPLITEASDEKTAVSDEVNADKAEIEAKKPISELFSAVNMVISVLIAVCLVFSLAFRVVPVSGHSMNPTLTDKDIMLTTSLYFGINRGDIIAVKRKDDTPLVKRVIAVAGDIVDIDFSTGEVTVNGEVSDEPYIAEATRKSLGFEGPITVPEGEIFVMGDNRNHSDDSRDPKIGALDTRMVFGKLALRLAPFNKFGTVK